MKKYVTKRYLFGLGLAAVCMVYASLPLIKTRPVEAQTKQSSPNVRPVEPQTSQTSVVFDSQGRMKVPTGFRKWVFVGAPLTPEGLNNGKYNCDAAGKNCTRSNFPEYHHVYIEQKNVDVFLKTGDFPEGTVIVKELTRVLDPTFPDGSRTEPSGHGFFNGEYNGIDVTVKDSKRFAETNNWGFFTFGHHPLPYAERAKESSAAECAGCHQTYVAQTDMTWIQFYPLLRDKKGY
jgi:hypothetical protein